MKLWFIAAIALLLLLAGCVQTNSQIPTPAPTPAPTPNPTPGPTPAPTPAPTPGPGTGELNIDSTGSLVGKVGEQFRTEFFIEGGYNGTGDWPLYEWFVNSGAMPNGLALAPEASVYCIRAPCDQPADKASIQGIPTKVGTYTFELLVEHDDGRKGKRSYSIEIQPSTSSNKIVYGMNFQDENKFRADCASKSGTFNDCDSSCPEGSEACTQVCVQTCTLP